MASSSSRVVVVTGSNDGIGYEIVKILAAQGHQVYLCSRDIEKGTKAIESLGSPSNVHLLHLDITKPDTIAQAVTKISHQFGKIDILINNAGVGHVTRAAEQRPSTVNDELLRECFEVNFFGLVHVTNALIPLLQKAEIPTILNVTTDMASITGQVPARVGIPRVIAYNTSKSAANAYAVGLSHDLPNFKVNVITPGWTQSKLNGFTGPKTAADGAAVIVKHAIWDKDGPTRKFWGGDGNELPW